MPYYNLVSRFLKAPKVLLLIIVLSIILAFQLIFYFQQELLLSLQSTYSKYSLPYSTLIFPKSFQHTDLDKFLDIYPGVVNSTGTEWSRILLAKQTNQLSFSRDIKFVDHNLTIFHSSNNIEDLKECKKLKEKIAVQISSIKDLSISMDSIFQQFVIDSKNNTFYQEILPYFGEHLKELFESNKVHEHFYRMAGSSVWLEDYGVHFMISRVLYSPRGARNQPIISMIYAQLFDKNWNELKDTTLVVPSNISGDRKYILEESTGYKMLKFPFFLPIPFWHNYDDPDMKYYGTEDPRIVLIKNKLGFEEPLVIFNSYNRRFAKYDDDNDELVKKEKYSRSMFVSWPWQYQYGKENTDGVSDPNFDHLLYNRVVRLDVPELSKIKAQKNWTPIFSDIDRAKHGYDKTLDFVYRWKNLEVLKCDLLEKEGECSFIYKMDSKLPYDTKVGALRGGTDMVNINSLIRSQTDVNVDEIIPEGREISIGFARAHLKDCGCGSSFYRPNMVIVIKDRVKILDEEESKLKFMPDNYLYKVSHLSSYISFDVPIFGWDTEYPDQVCKGNNVLLPNGVSNITITSLNKNPKTGRWVSDDYTTLTLSMNDFTVYSIYIKGLINSLLNTKDRSLFHPSSEADLLMPTDKHEELVGYNNDNIRCALQGSEEFCKIYGILNQIVYDKDELDGLDTTLLGQY